MPDEAHVAAIMKAASDGLQASFDVDTLRWVSRPDYKAGVADAKLIFTVKGERQADDAVFLVSNPDFPNSVADETDRAIAVAAALEPGIADRVLLPRYTGRYGEQTFAVYRKLYPISKQRIVRKVQHLHLERTVFEWLRDVCSNHEIRASDKEAESRFIDPLRFVSDSNFFSGPIRSCAHAALKEMDRGTFQPRCAIEHGDFWTGNVLLSNRWTRDFYISDWGSANLAGYPFVDLLRFAGSFGIPTKRRLAYFEEYCRAANLSPRDCEKYGCLGAGWLGLRRGEFPLERYISMAEGLFRSANQIASLSQCRAGPDC